MALPLILLGLATLCAAVVAYGTDPVWAQFQHGVDLIILSRRLEWPLLWLSVVFCIALIALVVAGRRRVWLLLGLAPVLAFFAHRFTVQPVGREVDDHPVFVAADDARFVADEDYVVGLSLKDEDFAYPYAQLFYRPVIVQPDRDQRILLLWSAYANRALACTLKSPAHGREVEVVSMPANALLVYDRQSGSFINGVTGLTPRGQKPTEVSEWLPVTKTTWGQWRQDHPGTQVLMPRGGLKTAGPTQPILPAYPMPPMRLDRPIDTRIALVTGSGMLAVDPSSVTREPLNLSLSDEPVLLLHPSPDGPLRAFRRDIGSDLRPRFKLDTSGKPAHAFLVDSDTGSKWSADGVWLDGPREFKGKKLAPMHVDDDLYWGVMKFWYPELELNADGNK